MQEDTVPDNTYKTNTSASKEQHPLRTCLSHQRCILLNTFFIIQSLPSSLIHTVRHDCSLMENPNTTQFLQLLFIICKKGADILSCYIKKD